VNFFIKVSLSFGDDSLSRIQNIFELGQTEIKFENAGDEPSICWRAIGSMSRLALQNFEQGTLQVDRPLQHREYGLLSSKAARM
jgi:hypothetical protein